MKSPGPFIYLLWDRIAKLPAQQYSKGIPPASRSFQQGHLRILEASLSNNHWVGATLIASHSLDIPRFEKGLASRRGIWGPKSLKGQRTPKRVTNQKKTLASPLGDFRPEWLLSLAGVFSTLGVVMSGSLLDGWDSREHMDMRRDVIYPPTVAGPQCAKFESRVSGDMRASTSTTASSRKRVFTGQRNDMVDVVLLVFFQNLHVHSMDGWVQAFPWTLGPSWTIDTVLMVGWRSSSWNNTTWAWASKTFERIKDDKEEALRRWEAQFRYRGPLSPPRRTQSGSHVDQGSWA